MKKAKILPLKPITDQRGDMIVVEGDQDIPFEIKRIFYIFQTQSDAVRGNHANKITEFIMICLSGSVKVKIDYATHEEIFLLQTPHEALYIPSMLWKEMYDFSKDAVLLVLASTHYDAEEYIKTKDEYHCAVIKDD